MKWAKRSEYHAESDCRNYFISKAIVSGGRTLYTAWLKKENRSLGTFDSLKIAQKACLDNSEKL